MIFNPFYSFDAGCASCLGAGGGIELGNARLNKNRRQRAQGQAPQAPQAPGE